MKYKALVFATLLIATFLMPVMAQGLDAAGVQSSLSPLTALIEGVMRVGWDLTQMFIGKDDASIAYFTYQLGFRKDEVVMVVEGTTDESAHVSINCSMGSFKKKMTTQQTTTQYESIACTATSNGIENFVFAGTAPLKVSNIEDYDENNEIDLIDVFEYIINNEYGDLIVTNGAKGQVMLFALLLPLGMLWFILQDFLASTGILRGVTVKLVSLGIALLAARSGVYTGLLSMISSIFGTGGFFMSMLSIYLIIAIILWFYGGVLKSKAIAEETETVANAVTSAFAEDLKRGLMMSDAAKTRADAKTKKDK